MITSPKTQQQRDHECKMRQCRLAVAAAQLAIRLVECGGVVGVRDELKQLVKLGTEAAKLIEASASIRSG